MLITFSLTCVCESSRGNLTRRHPWRKVPSTCIFSYLWQRHLDPTVSLPNVLISLVQYFPDNKTVPSMGSIEEPVSYLVDSAQKLHLSPTLKINELVQERRAKGHRIMHLGFGEATFPVQRDVLQAHGTASEQTSYLPVAGLDKLRKVRSQRTRGRNGDLLLTRSIRSPSPHSRLVDLAAALTQSRSS